MIRRTPDAQRVILAWWQQLHPNKPTGYRGDRAAVAQLRHASSVMAASMEPATINLCRALAAGPEDLGQVALFAAVLADLREDDAGHRVASALGNPTDAPLCSPLRFRRILEATDLDFQLTALRRALALLKHRGHLADLVSSLLDWNNPSRRDERRQRWLYDYYQTNNPEQSSLIGVEANL